MRGERHWGRAGVPETLACDQKGRCRQPPPHAHGPHGAGEVGGLWWQPAQPRGTGSGQCTRRVTRARCRQGSGHCPTVLRQEPASPRGAGSFTTAHGAPRVMFAQQPDLEGAAAEPSLLLGAARATLPGTCGPALPLLEASGGRVAQGPPLLPSTGVGQALSCRRWLLACPGSLPVPDLCPCQIPARARSLPVPSRCHSFCHSPGPRYVPGCPCSPRRPMVLGATAGGTNGSASPAPLPSPSAWCRRPLRAQHGRRLNRSQTSAGRRTGL